MRPRGRLVYQTALPPAIPRPASGASRTPKAQTFGLDEAMDVNAAVEYLRHRPFVDPNRIGVLGVGTGANAAMIAANRDPRIAALCLSDPLASPSDAIIRYIGPNR